MAKKVTLLFEEVRDGKKSNATFFSKYGIPEVTAVLFVGMVR